MARKATPSALVERQRKRQNRLYAQLDEQMQRTRVLNRGISAHIKDARAELDKFEHAAAPQRPRPLH
jgi:hypothetical protein